jgi:hypothetical protein
MGPSQEPGGADPIPVNPLPDNNGNQLQLAGMGPHPEVQQLVLYQNNNVQVSEHQQVQGTQQMQLQVGYMMFQDDFY